MKDRRTFIAILSNSLWSAALPDGVRRWLFPAGSAGEGGKTGSWTGNVKSWIGERQAKHHPHCLPCHLTGQMLVILCCFTLWTQTSLWPLLVPLEHKAGVLWVRFLPQCLWFELAELAQLAAELYSPKESSHIKNVNLKDSFVVGHLSAVKMWNHSHVSETWFVGFLFLCASCFYNCMALPNNYKSNFKYPLQLPYSSGRNFNSVVTWSILQSF